MYNVYRVNDYYCWFVNLFCFVLITKPQVIRFVYNTYVYIISNDSFLKKFNNNNIIIIIKTTFFLTLNIIMHVYKCFSARACGFSAPRARKSQKIPKPSETSIVDLAILSIIQQGGMIMYVPRYLSIYICKKEL